VPREKLSNSNDAVLEDLDAGSPDGGRRGPGIPIPSTFPQKAGDALGIVSARVGGDLGRFKEFIESRGSPTGSWRGEIHGDDVRPPTARPSVLGE
jgi:hypothetical protein